MLHKLLDVCQYYIILPIWFRFTRKNSESDKVFIVRLYRMLFDHKKNDLFCLLTFYSNEGWNGLVDEIEMEVGRISERNLGRDDRYKPVSFLTKTAAMLGLYFPSLCKQGRS